MVGFKESVSTLPTHRHHPPTNFWCFLIDFQICKCVAVTIFPCFFNLFLYDGLCNSVVHFDVELFSWWYGPDVENNGNSIVLEVVTFIRRTFTCYLSIYRQLDRHIIQYTYIHTVQH